MSEIGTTLEVRNFIREAHGSIGESLADRVVGMLKQSWRIEDYQVSNSSSWNTTESAIYVIDENTRVTVRIEVRK